MNSLDLLFTTTHKWGKHCERYFGISICMLDGPNANEDIMLMQNFILTYENSGCAICYMDSQHYLLYNIRMEFISH